MDKITRNDAMKSGLTYYFTDKPCPHGHVCKRFVSTYGCAECTDAHKKTYRKDPEFRGREMAYKAAYREENRDAVNAYARWYWKNYPNAKDVSDRTRAKNADSIRDYNATYHAENSDRMNAKSRLYAKNNPAYFRAKNAERRARLKSGGSHTAQDVLGIMKMQKYLCAYCKSNISKKYHVDHINPLKLGGDNSRKNLQCLCPNCNHRKSAKDPIVWAQEIGLLL